jgi:hypothetical protein
MPNRAGDSWVFKELRKGPKGVVETFIHYVSEGCTVSKKLDQRTDENTASQDEKEILRAFSLGLNIDTKAPRVR